jgi:hypothetical protein
MARGGMSEPEYPVTVAVRRTDGSVEHVRVGTAVRAGDTFRLTLGELSVGAPVERSAPRRAAPAQAAGGMVFPPYGRSKGAPIAGATLQDLEYYANGCRRTLNDPNKARWHDKERELLAAIEAEIAANGAGDPGGGGGGGWRGGDDRPQRREEDAPPPSDDDLPF